jgi:hypothetical protein
MDKSEYNAIVQYSIDLCSTGEGSVLRSTKAFERPRKGKSRPRSNSLSAMRDRSHLQARVQSNFGPRQRWSAAGNISFIHYDEGIRAARAATENTLSEVERAAGYIVCSGLANAWGSAVCPCSTTPGRISSATLRPFLICTSVVECRLHTPVCMNKRKRFSRGQRRNHRDRLIGPLREIICHDALANV